MSPSAPTGRSASATPSRQVALEALKRLSAPGEDLPAGETLDEILTEHPLSRRDRALATELVYGVLRQQRYLDAWVQTFSSPPIDRLPARLLVALRLALYQILFLEKIPASAAVNTAVQWIKRDLGKGPAGLANAILRAAIRDEARFTLPDPEIDPIAHLSVKHSHPDWMVRRWVSRLGPEKAESLLRANNSTPPITLRVNPRVLSRDELVQEVVGLGGSAQPTSVSPSGVAVEGVSPRQLPSFARGGFYVQDEAAQLVSYLVAPQPGETLLDACAAPGGKSIHLAELMGSSGTVIACDRSRERLNVLRENLRRMGADRVRALQTDAANPGLKAGFDRILVDAPCSALGTLRRNPEGKWRKTVAIIPHYAAQQRRLLDQLFPLVRKGGRIVYATCSTEPEENEAVVEGFLADHPQFQLQSALGFLPHAAGLVDAKGYFNTLLNPYRMDCFFAACLVHRPKGAA